MSKLEDHLKARAGKKQSFTKKLKALEETLHAKPSQENLREMVSDLDIKFKEAESICIDCECEDPSNAEQHREWLQEIRLRRDEFLNKVSLKSIEEERTAQESWMDDVRKKRDIVLDEVKVALNSRVENNLAVDAGCTPLSTSEYSRVQTNNSVNEWKSEQTAFSNVEKERKIMIERNIIEGHLLQLTEKALSIKHTATENQLLRLKVKIKNRTEEAENKNTELLLSCKNQNEQNHWMFKIFDEVDEAIEAIDSQIDRIREMKTKDPSCSNGLRQQNTPYTKPTQTSDFGAGIKSKEAASDLIKLKKINLPSFSGNKKEYPAWRATFAEFVDKTEKSPEHKLLQLKEVLQGEAAQVTNGLGYSREAYECAMARLDRKFGGSRREKTLILEEVTTFSPIRENSPEDLEKFADLLENLVLNFQDADRSMELGSGMLFVMLQRKLPVSVLTSYQRWVFEGKREESILTLKDYVMQEAQYHVIASETTKGISTSFTPSVSTCQTHKCAVCGGLHRVESCKEFLKMKLTARKNLVFKMKLCFKCLGQGHQAASCELQEGDKHKVLQSKDKKQLTSCVNSGVRANTFTLRIIPIIVKNCEKEMKINALLDDGSQQTFINKTVTSFLGVTENDQRDIDISLLGGRVDTLKSAGSVSIPVMPMERNAKFTLSALTTTQVTGDLRGRKWENVKGRYHHLHDIPLDEFCSKRVDMIIGLDNPRLHVSLEERVGNPGEPMARKTPLGWSIIGPIEHSNLKKPSTQFVKMHFLQNQSELQEINSNIQRMWKIEEFSDCNDVNLRSKKYETIFRETKSAIEKAEERYCAKIYGNKNKDELQINVDTAISPNKVAEVRNKQNQFGTQSGNRKGGANLVSSVNLARIKDNKDKASKTPEANKFDTHSGNRVGEANLVLGVRTKDQEKGKDNENSLKPPRYSSLLHLLRIRSWVNRYLPSVKMENNRSQVIKETQQEAFTEDIQNIRNNKCLEKTSALLSLNPLMDSNHVLRSNSRLVNAKSLSWNAKHPIILPDLIIMEVHRELQYVGANHVLTVLSWEYWIVPTREAIRKVENKCNKCKIRTAKIASQIMSPLPKFRVNGSLSAFPS